MAAKKRSAKSLTVPATVTYKKVKYQVVGINASAFASAKAKTLTLQTKKLTAGRVKNSLAGSSIARVKLAGAARAKKATYKKIFAQAISGKSVKVG